MKKAMLLPLVLAFTLLATLFAFVPAASASSGPGPYPKGCIPGYAYTNVSNWGTDRVQTSPEFYYNNNTSVTVTKTWTSTISVSVTISATGQASGDLNAVLAGVKAQVNAGVQFSITGTYTDSVTYNIPPGKSIGVTYGVTRQIAYGDYTYLSNYCVTTDYGYQESWSPWRLEWLKVAGNL
jgi:hypothetical protein